MSSCCNGDAAAFSAAAAASSSSRVFRITAAWASSARAARRLFRISCHLFRISAAWASSCTRAAAASIASVSWWRDAFRFFPLSTSSTQVASAGAETADGRWGGRVVIDGFGLYESPKGVYLAAGVGNRLGYGWWGENRGRNGPGRKRRGGAGQVEFPELAVAKGDGVLERGDVVVEVVPAEGERRGGAGGEAVEGLAEAALLGRERGRDGLQLPHIHDRGRTVELRERQESGGEAAAAVMGALPFRESIAGPRGGSSLGTGQMCRAL
nr:unnamed protein product [Digitaria exilis]